jgi:hypothetical protein
MPKFADIPQMTRDGYYQVNVGWDYLEDWIAHNRDKPSVGFEMDPDFQRGHVWTEQQQIRYVEFMLRGGKSSRVIYWNCKGWMHTFEGPMVLVDGKQRISAVLRFLGNEILAFGHKREEYTDRLGLCHCDFLMNVNNLKTRAEVLQWYIDLNAGGVAHTNEEINKVRRLLDIEQDKK